MSALWMWFRVEWRGRWRALVGLALLIGFAAATVQATAAGARRGATSVDRLVEVTEPATVAMLVNRGPFDWDQVRAMPDVAAVTAFAVSAVGVEDIGDHPELDPTTIASFPFVDDDVLNTVERPVVLSGRLLDSSRVDEVVVSPKFVEYFDRGVGDRLTLRLYDPSQLDTVDFGDVGPPAGPAIAATIVGVIRSPWFSDNSGNPAGFVLPSPAVSTRYPDSILGTSENININALVRLNDRDADLDGFLAEFARLTGIENVETFDLVAAAQHASDVATFESRALLLLCLTALLASMVLIAVAISRYVGASFGELETLGAVGGTVAAYAASNRFPIGSASNFEPSPGYDFDVVLLLVPLVAVVILAVVAAMVSERALHRTRPTARRSSAVESWTSNWPLPASLGTRYALSGRTSRTSASARPALLGAVLAVTGMVSALTFASGVADATDDFDRFGQTYDLYSFFGADGEDFVDTDAALTAIADHPDVEGVLDVATEAARSATGPVTMFTLGDARAGARDIVTTAGRLPSTDSEIALAPITAQSSGADIGDTLTLSGSAGSETFTVTGLAFVPAGPHNNYADGAWVTPAAFSQLNDGFRFHFALVSTTSGADLDAVIGQLGEQNIGLERGPIIPPTERSELAQLTSVPLLLAVFLAVLGVGAVGHTLASTARRRRHDVAMLRAFGMRPRESASIVFVQAGAIALVGLAIGVPAGLVLGRVVWRTVALDTPIEFVVPESWATVGAISLAVMIVAALLAIRPSRRLATLRLGTELRNE